MKIASLSDPIDLASLKKGDPFLQKSSASHPKAAQKIMVVVEKKDNLIMAINQSKEVKAFKGSDLVYRVEIKEDAEASE